MFVHNVNLSVQLVERIILDFVLNVLPTFL